MNRTHANIKRCLETERRNHKWIERELIKRRENEIMKYTMGLNKGRMMLFRHGEQHSRPDNAHIEFWDEITALRAKLSEQEEEIGKCYNNNDNIGMQNIQLQDKLATIERETAEKCAQIAIEQREIYKNKFPSYKGHADGANWVSVTIKAHFSLGVTP